MRRQDNPILQQWVDELNEDPTGDYWWGGFEEILNRILEMCRWLDAEDEWVANLGVVPLGSWGWVRWREWREARMAEAGVL